MPVETNSVLSIDLSLTLGDFSMHIKNELRFDGVLGLFGPSGAGKSTLLRIIAGLERKGIGTLKFTQQCWQDTAKRQFTAAHLRSVGFVFQDSRLFEHLSVAENIEYANRRATKGNANISVDEIIEIFDLRRLMRRQVGDLSGGECKRVAIARALAAQPQLLLLDEPLAGLDIQRKAEILPYLDALQNRFDLPMIYVSHAVDEMARVAKHIVVMNLGRISAVGNAADVLSDLPTLGTASGIESASALTATVKRPITDFGLTELSLCGQNFSVPIQRQLTAGDAATLYIRASDVALATSKPSGLSIRNVLAGSVISIDTLDRAGSETFAIVTVNIGGATLRAQLTRQSISELGLQIETKVFALVKTASFNRF